MYIECILPAHDHIYSTDSQQTRLIGNGGIAGLTPHPSNRGTEPVLPPQFILGPIIPPIPPPSPTQRRLKQFFSGKLTVNFVKNIQKCGQMIPTH